MTWELLDFAIASVLFGVWALCVVGTLAGALWRLTPWGRPDEPVTYPTGPVEPRPEDFRRSPAARRVRRVMMEAELKVLERQGGLWRPDPERVRQITSS